MPDESINIILSICIPTYNRAALLEKTLISIIEQDIFINTNDVEVVISDNCSEDNTRDISDKFVSLYGNKIRYFRNDVNITDLNFEIVLSHGRGKYLKLNNDTLIHNRNTLELMLRVIKENLNSQNIIFFSNGSIKNYNNGLCLDFDDFVKSASFYTTWIACFGIWKQDFDSLVNFSRKSEKQLIQTDVLFRLASTKRQVFIDNTILFEAVNVSKGGYNIYKVFVSNYLGLFDEYVEKKQLKRKTVNDEKSKLLFHFILPWTLLIITQKQKYSFDTKEAFFILFKKYHFNHNFYLCLIILLYKVMKYYLNSKILKITYA